MIQIQQLEHMTELSLIIALPNLIMDVDKKKIRRTRMESLLNRLIKHSQKESMKIKTLTQYDIDYGLDRLHTFFNTVQWSENSRIDVRVLVSFLLGLIEESATKYPLSIIDALNDTYERINRDNNDSDYIKIADNALEIWKSQNPGTRAA